MDKANRIESVTRWKEELPCDAEYKESSKNLAEADMQVDYIITHTAPEEIIIKEFKINPDQHDIELTGYLEWVMHSVKFKKWFFGHWHEDKLINDKFEQLLFKVVKI